MAFCASARTPGIGLGEAAVGILLQQRRQNLLGLRVVALAQTALPPRDALQGRHFLFQSRHALVRAALLLENRIPSPTPP